MLILLKIFINHLKYIIKKINPIISQKARGLILPPKINLLANPGKNY